MERSAHLAYEKVVLTPAAAEQLGQKLSEDDRQRGAVSMSGRKGLGVKADDLIDQLEANALAEVASRHPELDRQEQRDTAHKIAVGALRYFLLKYSRTSIISFDFKEALAFDGETGPYIQYSVVRANSIFRKLTEAGEDLAALDIQSVPRERVAADRAVLQRLSGETAALELTIAQATSAIAALIAEQHREEKEIVGYEAQLSRTGEDEA